MCMFEKTAYMCGHHRFGPPIPGGHCNEFAAGRCNAIKQPNSDPKAKGLVVAYRNTEFCLKDQCFSDSLNSNAAEVHSLVDMYSAMGKAFHEVNFVNPGGDPHWSVDVQEAYRTLAAAFSPAASGSDTVASTECPPLFKQLHEAEREVRKLSSDNVNTIGKNPRSMRPGLTQLIAHVKALSEAIPQMQEMVQLVQKNTVPLSQKIGLSDVHPFMVLLMAESLSVARRFVSMLSLLGDGEGESVDGTTTLTRRCERFFHGTKLEGRFQDVEAWS